MRRFRTAALQAKEQQVMTLGSDSIIIKRTGKPCAEKYMPDAEQGKAREKAAMAGLSFAGKVQYRRKKVNRRIKTFKTINKILGKLL